MKTLDSLPWQNRLATLGKSFYAHQKPTPVPDPYLINSNPTAAELLQLPIESFQRTETIAALSGNRIIPGSQPLSQLYAGHQFGHYVPQLGDGRAILLGDLPGNDGQRWELQLKGAGPTPFSRGSDGLAVLRSTIREYLCSEAMHALDIPTTRALAITGTDQEVYREQIETGAILTRLAPSFIRFGSFEVFYYRSQFEPLKQLADYLLEHHYLELAESDNRYLALLEEIISRTAHLIAQWQLVGFAHGVMNSDNMSALGLTLDYGPFGFLDRYEPGFICNHSDHHGRYAFDQQPQIGLWNLTCLAQALLPLLDDTPATAVEKAQQALAGYQQTYARHYRNGLNAKLGLQQQQKGDLELAQALLEEMAKQQADYTLVFRSLGKISLLDHDSDRHLTQYFRDPAAVKPWLESYRQRLNREESSDLERQQRMNQTNPKYILRNYLAQIAIAKAEQKDFSEVERLLQLLQKPFDEQPELEHYAAEPPDWAEEISVSCSS